MLCLNCAALSANLLESELFGHERGAFTGADRVRKGRFELADTGTLLLDEISELAPPLQAKLLRVLQEGQFERVGSSVTRRADVRVIATTNRDLNEWVAKKRFRHDLPALRERSSDIPELVEYFVVRATPAGTPSKRVTSPAMQALIEYSWPGNVRELENLCCRAVTLCGGDTIELSLVEPWLRGPTAPVDGLGLLREGRMLEDMERQLIERMLRRFDGHRVKTAKALGMGVRTLGMKLKQWREEGAVVERRGVLVASG
jgi:DNA-binding NtrC family response regulator